ncbi:hypothetical protein WI25_05505 [Burkholderia cepacia]|nr:hypothetical protein WI25_05505 [Burkholderia cepacia]
MHRLNAAPARRTQRLLSDIFTPADVALAPLSHAAHTPPFVVRAHRCEWSAALHVIACMKVAPANVTGADAA